MYYRDKLPIDCSVHVEKDNERYDGVKQKMEPHNINLYKMSDEFIPC